MANCWKCGMYLGEKDEWKKMTTARGDICILCFNKAKEVDGPRIQADMDAFSKDKEYHRQYFIDSIKIFCYRYYSVFFIHPITPFSEKEEDHAKICPVISCCIDNNTHCWCSYR